MALAMIFWLAVSLLPFPRPDPAPASAPPQDFSAARALEHVRAIAQKPHPVGSAEHQRVRDYIRAELARLGLNSEIEAGFAEVSLGRFHGSGNVENIVARLPGSANTRPLMLAAHYDSVPRGPGAADDAHGVAVLLETLRALRSGPPLRNDVIFLITDGEERGLLGAILFMREHPWRSEPAAVLNFEARGTGGNAFMFETSAGNEWLIRDLAAAVPQADASSFSYEVYRRMPNNTDLTVFKRGGLAGMNFAFIGHVENYHRATDDVAHLDPRSVQEQGRYALSLARRLGNEDLRAKQTGDAIYFATPMTPLMVYPASWSMFIGAFTVAILAAAAWRTRRLWTAAPFLAAGVLELVLAHYSPGVTYLLAWPLLGGVAAFAALATAPESIGIGWRAVVMMLCPALVFPVWLALLPSVVVALGWGVSAPFLALAVLLMLLCVSPQLVLLR